ncbi:uncharacterized protein LOC100377529 [Saccoglossus kowalevskii]|uniref:Transcription elongation factor B polypeptide 3-like n=1 Tax=Saccoglossus kowalevskii TaxID=10224 RepID=A0ABM0GU41_SACKO|nr:PREDICTED: transcription elongation factor B polypeptide 3-like [Saccoglossus kowalevskii]
MADSKILKTVRLIQIQLKSVNHADERKILTLLHELHKMPISIDILQKTGIGKLVNGFRKIGGRVGDYAKNLVLKWKQLLTSMETVTYSETTGHTEIYCHERRDEETDAGYSHHGDDIDESVETKNFKNKKHKKQVHDVEHSSTNRNEEFMEKKKEKRKEKKREDKSASQSKYAITETEHDSKPKVPEKKVNVKKKTPKKVQVEEVSFESTGLSFADCLNLDAVAPKKIKKDKISSSSRVTADIGHKMRTSEMPKVEHQEKKKEKHKDKHRERKHKHGHKSERKDEERHKEKHKKVKDGHEKKRKLEPVSDEMSSKKTPVPPEVDLPSINADYKPLRLPQMEDLPKRKSASFDEAALTALSVTSRQSRTKVFSGRAREQTFSAVPSLYDSCMRILCENIDALEDVGGVPFDILEPVLKKCNAEQLFRLEDFNPHFLEDTNDLWQIHCIREFKLCKPNEFESWRELYLRKVDERQAKLDKITANISAQMAHKKPERQVKMAFMSGPAKPPREVLRKQVKLGTAGPISQHKSPSKPHRSNTITINHSRPSSSSSSSYSQSGSSSYSGGSSGSSYSHSGGGDAPSNSRPVKTVKVVAPMMMKSLKMMKRFRR